MAFRWRVDVSNIESWFGSFVIFQGFGQILLGNFCDFQEGGGGGSAPPARSSGSAHDFLIHLFKYLFWVLKRTASFKKKIFLTINNICFG